ncbi:NAD/NADP-dependent betaine aldehyde dehydrogenase [compost metagenome]
MSRSIRSGIVWVNTFLDIPTEIPLGGIQQSGFGRENGRFAIEEFTTTKTVVIQNPATTDRFV